MDEGQNNGLQTIRATQEVFDNWRFVLFFVFVNLMVAATLFSHRTIASQFILLLIELIALPVMFYLVNVERRVWLMSLLVPALGLVLVILTRIFDADDNGLALFAVIQFVITSFLIMSIIHFIYMNRVIDFQTIFAAVSLYVLIGLLFARIYFILDMFAPPLFVDPGREILMSDYMYYSFVTLTTTGYGDLSEASQIGRMISVLEATFGQLYLVVVIALIVGHFSSNLDEHLNVFKGKDGLQHNEKDDK